VMVPFACHVNHSPWPHCVRYGRLNPATRTLDFPAFRPCPQGQQVRRLLPRRAALAPPPRAWRVRPPGRAPSCSGHPSAPAAAHPSPPGLHLLRASPQPQAAGLLRVCGAPQPT
jgi:hypothetical protein